MAEQGRLLHSNWDLYDTRHTVFQPAKLKAEELERAIGGRMNNSIPGPSIGRGGVELGRTRPDAFVTPPIRRAGKSSNGVGPRYPHRTHHATAPDARGGSFRALGK